MFQKKDTTEPVPLPDSCFHCGRSHLTHMFRHEVATMSGRRRALGKHTEVCQVCFLTDSRRRNRQGFERWFRRAVEQFKREEGFLDEEPKPPPERAPRYHDEFYEVISARMRHARKLRKITHKQMAAALGYNRSMYSCFEANLRQHPSDRKIVTRRAHLRAWQMFRASQVLGCSMEWLCGLTDNPGWKTPDLDPALGFEEYLRHQMEKSLGKL